MSSLPSLDFLRHLGGAVVVTDREGAIHHWSPGMHQLLGFSDEEMQLKNWWAGFPLAIRMRIETALSGKNSASSFVGACLLKNQDGALTPVGISISPLVEGGPACLGWLTVCHKLPEKIAGVIIDSARVESVDPKLDAGLAYQVRKARAIGALSSGLSHDFNNVFTSIFAHLDLMMSASNLPESLLPHAVRSRANATRAAELISRLLAFSRPTPAVLAPVQLSALLDEALVPLRRSMGSSIELHRVAPSGDLWPVEVDADQMMQVISNLCLNARDALPKGGVLSLEMMNVTITEDAARPPQHAGEFVRLSVSDNGKGLPQEGFTRLTGPDFTSKELGKGLNLGLAIANSIVTEHGGWMEVESELGEGSRFHVYLPRFKGVSLG